MKPLDRARAAAGVTGAGKMAAAAPAKTPAQSNPTMWTRSNGVSVPMADLNPYHRAAAIKKAEAAGDRSIVDALRASGPIPE